MPLNSKMDSQSSFSNQEDLPLSGSSLGLESALLMATRILLEERDIKKAIPLMLTCISEEIRCSRSYIYQKIVESKNPMDFEMQLLYEYTHPDFAENVVKDIPLNISSDSFFKELLVFFDRKEIFFKQQSGFPDEMLDILTSQGVKAIITAPIYINDKDLWGFIGFDNCYDDTLWDASLINLLSSFVNIFGGVIQKDNDRKLLLRQQANIRRAHKLAKIGNYSFDINNFTVKVSPEILHFLGIAKDKGTSLESLLSFLEANNKLTFLKELNQILKAKKRFSVDYKFLSKNGKVSWVNIKGQFMYDKQRDPQHIIGTIQDITSRKKDNEALKESKEEYKVLVESMNEGMIQFKTDGTILNTNKRFCSFLGLQTEDLHGDSIFRYLANESALRILTHNIGKIKEGKDVVFEILCVNRNGVEIWLHFTCSPIIDEEGITVGISGFISEITNRKIAEIENAQLASIIENAIDFIAYINRKGVIKYLNNSGRAMLEITEADELGDTPLSIIDYLREDFATLFRTSIFDNLMSNGFWKGDLVLQSKSGNEFTLSTVINIHDLHNKEEKGSVYFSVIARDVSGKIKIENEIRAKNKELEKINTELDRFVYSASHDLRAPLTSILGLVGLAETEELNNNLADYLDKIKRSIHKLDKFIQDIISYSRNSRLEVGHDIIDFKSILNDCLDNLRYMAHAEQIKGIYEFNLKQKFYSDSSRISIIMNNLISNSVKYHNLEQKNPWLEVTITTEDNWAILTFKDNGEGIEQDKINKIFEMFYRVSKKSSGSGLGLYIVHEIINKLGGSISVTSEEGVGTEFIVKLPNLKPH